MALMNEETSGCLVAEKSKRKFDGTVGKLETLERSQKVITRVRFDCGGKENKTENNMRE